MINKKYLYLTILAKPDRIVTRKWRPKFEVIRSRTVFNELPLTDSADV